VLRHNLRNDLTAVRGYVGIVADRTDDDELADMLETARNTVNGVIENERRPAASNGRSRRRAIRPHRCPSATCSNRSQPTSRPSGRDASRSTSPKTSRYGRTRTCSSSRSRNLIENGIDHSDAADPRVRVGFDGIGPDRTAVFAVSDDGPGIPDHELAVLERGEETSLEHGSGLGLWIVSWAITALGGELTFETDEDGTTVAVRLPGATDGQSAKAADRSEAVVSDDRSA